jgi:hypothetical protein
VLLDLNMREFLLQEHARGFQNVAVIVNDQEFRRYHTFEMKYEGIHYCIGSKRKSVS